MILPLGLLSQTKQQCDRCFNLHLGNTQTCNQTQTHTHARTHTQTRAHTSTNSNSKIVQPNSFEPKKIKNLFTVLPNKKSAKLFVHLKPNNSAKI